MARQIVEDTSHHNEILEVEGASLLPPYTNLMTVISLSVPRRATPESNTRAARVE